MRLELKANGRLAVINNNTLQCFRNNGIKREHFISVWPAVVIEDARKIKRMAINWIEKCKLPEGI